MVASTGYRVKIIEKNGMKLENLLVRRDPYSGWDCGRGDCNCCKVKPTSNTKNNCNRMSVLYAARCENCREAASEEVEDDEGSLRPVGEYIGESGKSLYTRSCAHINNYRLLDPQSFILRHQVKCHPEVQLGRMNFTFSVKSHFPSAFRRQVAEAVSIQLSINDRETINLNSKLEYNRCLIPDIMAEESQEETKREHKLDEDLLKLKQKGTKIWEQWKRLGVDPGQGKPGDCLG